MEISTDVVKALRERTGVSVMQCRKALEEAAGDAAKAEEILRSHSAGVAAKKSGRLLAAGAIGSYAHDYSKGAMVLLSSESDFVAKNPEFSALARDLAMQVAAMDPGDTEALLKQPFIKDDSKTIKDLLNEATQKFGEKVEITQFARFSARG
jgi:elongation factor Ts